MDVIGVHLQLLQQSQIVHSRQSPNRTNGTQFRFAFTRICDVDREFHVLDSFNEGNEVIEQASDLLWCPKAAEQITKAIDKAIMEKLDSLPMNNLTVADVRRILYTGAAIGRRS